MKQPQYSLEQMKERFASQPIGTKILYFPSVTSTMDAASEELKRKTDHGTVILADEQTLGQGRLSRRWASPYGGVYISIVLFPKKEHVPILTRLAALSVADTLMNVGNVEVDFKWPNDVLLNGKKIGGIIARSGLGVHDEFWAIVGIGVNINTNVSLYPEISHIATSLKSETGSELSLQVVVESLLKSFSARYKEMENGSSLVADWKAKLVSLGKEVTVTHGAKMIKGVAASVDDSGALIVQTECGAIVSIVSGDVSS